MNAPIPALYLLSFVVAVTASYIALILAGRVSRARRGQALAWLMGGGITMGTGIWGMHFMGMIAFYLPIAVSYSIRETVLSWVTAIALSLFALLLLKATRRGSRSLIAGGVIIGLGLVTMHYVAIEAITPGQGITYDPALFLVSVAVGIVGSIVALWLAFRLRGGVAWHSTLTRFSAAFIMGLAITGMQFTNMAASRFGAQPLDVLNDGLDHNWLTFSVAGFTMTILAFVLLLALIDMRSRRYANALSASLKTVHSKLAFLGTHDALTSLPNRLLLIKKIAKIIAANNTDKPLLAILHLNIDRLKTVNESLGRAVGDQLLNAFVLRISQKLNASDMLVRLSGDEFVVLRELADQSDAARLAENLMTLLRPPLYVPLHEVHLTASIGISTYPHDGDTAESLLARADMAMSHVKLHGRNNYQFFTPEMHERNRNRVNLESGLRPALRENEFRMYYQPKVDIQSGKIVGVEGLLRWQHPEYGLVPPTRFIPLAEESGLIVALGEWVLEAACRQSRLWQNRELMLDAAAGRPIPISVNLSAHQFLQRDLVDSTITILSRHGISTASIILELTEGSLMGNPEAAIDVLRELAHLGVRVSVDDFGTGYSSLSYLRRFPLSEIKIDRSFVQLLDSNQEDRAIVHTIVTLAHSLQLTVIAEGVAKIEQLRFLRQIGCDQYQGFLFSEPVPAGVITEMLARQQSTE
ncbi:putative bifunctional diguanylate cyclase/phosphodiesterase [Glaciimonas immobilis]|uniref:Diguanylate cyclase (GGDEF)-like protein n=1 Tax=Glaciimonas immobilis TaxID=728004 RepID=A0A840RR81_9BURK|nr:EAL domain-containing protein [Glaciimonas immobilis]KAF3996806.1 EAL domain-containing protein [Glaciimonas immobilis]MBB5199652.1 diguanylate cyclase (GGDEF)-like protein [Glaciimonas immobilis]